MTSVVNGYTDVATLKSWANVTVSTYDATLLPVAINAASRAIDKHCNRSFWLRTQSTDRTFEPQDLYVLDLGAQPYADIGNSTITIKTDSGGDGTFETTWQSTDFELLPYNAPYEGPEAKPWTKIRAVGSQTFPLLVATALTRRDRIKITAQWGWPAVPDPVTQACLILAARYFDRKNSVNGIGGTVDFGPVRITGEDKDVANLLHGYRKIGVLVA